MTLSQQPEKLPDRTDVAIIGGGMVGLSLALLLSQVMPEKQILVIEAFPVPVQAGDQFVQPSFDARSTAISASTQAIFEQLDLWQALSQHVAPIRHIHVSDRGHPGATRLSAEKEGLDTLGFVIENRRLGQQLFAALTDKPRIKLVAPLRVDSLIPTADGMQIYAGGGRCLASLAVVADGADSSTLASVGIVTQRTRYDRTALIANLALARPHGEIAYERFTESGPVALLPLTSVEGRHRAALVWTLQPEEAERLSDVGEGDFLSELHDLFGYRAGQFLQCGVRSCYPLELTIAEEQVRRHLVVVGNAAHFLHPVAGQGFNLALRDVARLVEVLGSAARQDQPLGELSVLEAYVAEQIADQRNTIRFSDNLPRIFGLRSPLPIAGRNLGLIAMDLVPSLRQGFARFGSGLATRAVRLHG